jgi:DNA-binding PadR family transcriptional regulator
MMSNTQDSRPDEGRGRANRQRRQRPLPRTPIALSVLNLLHERPMHAYEMRTMMRERGHDRAFQIRESSVYDTVARLADRGFIEPVEVTKQGRRPERTVYAITEAGEDELLVWLRDLTIEPATEYPAFAAPLEAEISASDTYRNALAAQFPEFPRLFGIEEEYAQAMRRAELDWVRAIAAQLADGTLPWPDIEDVMRQQNDYR